MFSKPTRVTAASAKVANRPQTPSSPLRIKGFSVRTREANAEKVGVPCAFSQSGILVSKKDGSSTPLFPFSEPMLASKRSSWTGLLVEHHRMPPVEFPERVASTHQVAVHFRSATLTWFLGGHPQTVRVARGSINIVPQGTLLGGYGKNETEFLMFSLDPPFVDRIARRIGATTPVELIQNLGANDQQIEHIALAFKDELEMGCPSGRLYGDSLAVALVARLLAKFAACIPVAPDQSRVLPLDRLRTAIDYINDNLSEDLTLGEIADAARLNPFYFSRIFRQSTGTSPHQYVLQRRVERAKRLLLDRRLSLVEVALVVGFQNQSHFTALFHRLTGVTPKTYREGLLRQSNSIPSPAPLQVSRRLPTLREQRLRRA